jgi:phosphatidylglycerophosphate synthase
MRSEELTTPTEQFPLPDEVTHENVEHIATPANAMTLARPILGGIAAKMLATGERGRYGVLPWVIGMAASDAEGNVGRLVDKWSIAKTGQKNGYGTTELGKALDPVADTIGFLEIAGATLASPLASRLGKWAVGIVLTQESTKAVWAVQANSAHKAKHDGEKLTLDVTRTGKIATGAKFAALASAVLTHDLEPGLGRTAAGIAALGSAVVGVMLGEKARRGYNKDLHEKGVVVSMVPRFLSRRRRRDSSASTKMAA